MSKIKAIIFDMDGVLIDAKEWHYESLNRALSLFGFNISRYEHLVSYDGLPTKRKLEMLSIERGLPRGLHSFINDLKQQYTIELIHSKCRPIFQREFALAKLREQGYRTALCSNSIRKTVDLMLEKSNLTKFFDLVLSNQDVSAAKPDPEIYIKAIQSLEVKPEDCLIVEDNSNGILAAQRAGAKVMEIKDISEVRLDNILATVQRIEAL